MRNQPSASNIDESINFNQNLTHIVALVYLSSGLNFFLRADSNLGEDFLLSIKEIVKINEFFIDVKTSLFGFFLPFFSIAISFESDLLSFLYILRNNVIY